MTRIKFPQKTELIFGGGGSDVIQTAREYHFAVMVCVFWRRRQAVDPFNAWWSGSDVGGRLVTAYHATASTALPEFEHRRHVRETSIIRHRVWTDDLGRPDKALACGYEDLFLTLAHIRDFYSLNTPPALPSLSEIKDEVLAKRDIFDGLRALGPYFPTETLE